jgi:RHS repeat-associated protein
MGRMTQTIYPDTTFESGKYDAEGHRISSTDRLNRTTQYKYDQLGRLMETDYPDSSKPTTTYDHVGKVISTTDANGNTTQYAYDDAGRRMQVTDALLHVTMFDYDAVGNQIKVTDANQRVVQYQYDANNRRTTVIYPDSTTDQTVYDALGRTISKTDQASLTTQFQYDKPGRLTLVTDALNQTTQYAYDEVGNRISQTDANTHITKFEYDKLGRRTKRTLPLGMSETMIYDAAGNLKTKIDFNGKLTTYVYDSNNRLTQKIPDPSFNAATVSFQYTNTGQRSMMVDASGTTSYVYDQRDHLTQKAAPAGTLTYMYDKAGDLTSIRSSNASGASVDYTYDPLNRLSKVLDNRLASGMTTYSYDPAGNLQGYLYPNGVQSGYQYDALNRLKNLTLSKGATTLASYAYQLGQAGNRTQVIELGGRQVDWTYDKLYRLTKETIAGSGSRSANGVISYQYDAVGNRKQRDSTLAPVPAAAYTYDANDRLTTDTYDADGNTTASGANNYAYDFENHLTSQDSGAVTIAYDGDGNRVSKTTSGTTTKYLVDDRNLTGYAQVLEEISGGTVQRVYTYGLNRISQSQAAGTTFYGYDGHGSVRLLTDATGAVTDHYDYDAFGNVVSQTGSTANVYLYSGEQSDPNLGLYYLRARYLNQLNGRFITTDPLPPVEDEPLSIHRYAYAFNRPIDLHDPSGLWPTDIHNDILDRAFHDLQPNDLLLLKEVSARQDCFFGHDDCGGLGGQDPALAYEHAMSDGDAHQSPAMAETLYDNFLARNLTEAKVFVGADPGVALTLLGQNLHAIADSLSPAHIGFQPWRNPLQHPLEALQHRARESQASTAERDQAARTLRNYYDEVFKPITGIAELARRGIVNTSSFDITDLLSVYLDVLSLR